MRSPVPTYEDFPGLLGAPPVPSWLVLDLVDVVRRATRMTVDVGSEARDAGACTVEAVRPLFEALGGAGSPDGTQAAVVFAVSPTGMQALGIEGGRGQTDQLYVLVVRYWNEAVDALTGARDNKERRWKRHATEAGLARAGAVEAGLAAVVREADRAVGLDRFREGVLHRDDAVRYLAYYHVLDLWRRERAVVRVAEKAELRPLAEWSKAARTADALAVAVVREERGDPGALTRRLSLPTEFFDWAVREGVAAGAPDRTPRDVRDALRTTGVIEEGESQRGRTRHVGDWLDRLREWAWHSGWDVEETHVPLWREDRAASGSGAPAGPAGGA